MQPSKIQTISTKYPRAVMTQARQSIVRHQRALKATATRMLDDTGGELGRDFTKEEYKVFQALKSVQTELRRLSRLTKNLLDTLG